MYEEDLHIPASKMSQPVEKLTLTGMGGKSIYRKDLGPYGNFLIKETNFLRAIHDLTTRRSLSLKTDKDNTGAFPPYVVSQMVLYPPCIGHAAGGNDNRRS
jgi:hypothetical protein